MRLINNGGLKLPWAVLNTSIHVIRYFSHATIATGVALGRLQGEGRIALATSVGQVPVDVRKTDGQWTAVPAARDVLC